MNEFAVMIGQLIPKPIIPADIGRVDPAEPPRKKRTYRAPRTKDMTLLACSRCGVLLPVATGYYIRATGSKTHVEGAPMQPCRKCTNKKQAEYRARQRAALNGSGAKD